MTRGWRAWGDRRAVIEAVAEAREVLDPVKGETLSLLRKLVRTDSVAVPPRGAEGPAQRILLRELHSHAVEAELYDTESVLESGHPLVRHGRDYKNRPNLIARLPGTGGGRSLLLSGHIDTVPPGQNEWENPPFSASVKQGKLFGRGAWDMKGGLASHFAVLIGLRKAGRRLSGDLLAESVIDEEWAGGGGTLAARLRGISADACVITEGTGLRVLRATRGGLFVDIIARAGDSSAYFSREEVISPAIPVGRILAWVDEWRERRRKINRGRVYRDFPDPAPVQVLALEANRFCSNTPWSAPLEAKLRLYFQFLPHENQVAVIQRIRLSFERFCSHDPFFRIFPPEWKPVVDPSLVGHELPANHPWTRCVATSAQAVLERPVIVTAAEYPCDAFINQREFGIPTLLFGPCGAGAHNIDEYVTLDSVQRTAEVLLTAALLWCQ